MFNKKIMLGIATLAIGTAVILPQPAFAYRGDPNAQGPNYTPERHAAMQQALANNDYQLWQELQAEKGVVRRVTAENFSKFAQAHQLAMQGKPAAAVSVRAEFGLGQQRGDGSGAMNGQGRVSR